MTAEQSLTTSISKVIYINTGATLGNYISYELGINVEIANDYLMHFGYSRMTSFTQTIPSDYKINDDTSLYQKITFRVPSFYDTSNHYQIRFGKIFYPRLRALEFLTIEAGFGFMHSFGPKRLEKNENNDYTFTKDDFNTVSFNLASMVKLLHFTKRAKFYPSFLVGPQVSINKTNSFGFGLYYMLVGYHPVRKNYRMFNPYSKL